MAADFAGASWRDRSLEQLSSRTFDLLVVGAGIVGARVAHEAARAGLRTALVDAGDFGGATSSASGKLLHGGMRYLRTGDLRLVRRSQRERRILSSRVAPHLTRPLPMVAATEHGGALAASRLAAGLLAYTALDGLHEPRHRFVSDKEARHLVPPLISGGPFALLNEAGVDDHRLTLATVGAAARWGAVVANHVCVVELERPRGGISGAVLRGRGGEGRIRLSCRAVVNAAGPWMDCVRRLEDPGSRPITRLSKGVHLTLPAREEWLAATALSFDDSRAVYAVPVQGMLLVGSTDTLHEGDPGEAAVEPSDVATLLESISFLLPPELAREDLVRHSFAGLRVLPTGAGDTIRASRGHIVSVGPAGMVSVGGGKLTTHRLIALDALRLLPAGLRPNKIRPSEEPLPGAGPVNTAALRERLDTGTAAHLAALYGSESARLLEYPAPDTLERIHPEAPDIRAQIHHAVTEEWAVTPDDVLRRTSLGSRGLSVEDPGPLSGARSSA